MSKELHSTSKKKIMKLKHKFFTVSLLIFSLHHFAIAQTNNKLSLNNLKAVFRSDGQLFYDDSTTIFEIPKGGGRNSISAAGLWIGGFDAGKNIHLAAQTYRESGTDFWPGPLNIKDGSIDSATSKKYDKVWKVTRLEIDSFLLGLSFPASIKNWPGNGDTTNGEALKLAPFIDLNSNGIYEPLLGEYPDMKGDEMLWWVYNDNLDVHTESKAKPLGFEIQAWAYVYGCSGTLLQNTLFLNYRIINRSQNVYDSCHIGLWSDIDIGNLFDDYIGCDINLNSFFGYNSTNYDRDTTIKKFSYKGYKNFPPAQGITFLKGISDDAGKEMKMSNFIYYNNDNSLEGNPSFPTQYNNYLSGKWLNGDRITKGGVGFGGTKEVNYTFPGDVHSSTEWSEISAGNIAGDRRGLGSFGPVTIKSGDEKNLTIAFHFQQANNGNNLKSVDLLKSEISSLTQLYKANALQSCSGITTCLSGDSCVWPGDADNNKSAEIYDIFSTGYVFGNSGPQRILASSNWCGQYANKWVSVLPDGTNANHVDANGDGKVDSLDVLPLDINYTMKHLKNDYTQGSEATDPILSINVLQDSIQVGKELTLKINLGDGSIPAANVFGAAFSIHYDPKIIDSGSFKFSIQNSWLSDTGKNILVIAKDLYGLGRTDIGISKTTKNTMTDSGEIIILKYKMLPTDNLSGGVKCKFSITDQRVVDKDLKNITVRTEGDSVLVYNGIRGQVSSNLINFVRIYPNPANNFFIMKSGSEHPMDISVYNLTGQLMKEIHLSEHQTNKVCTEDWKSGVYLIKISDKNGVAFKTLILQN